jgi:enediyne biosynthesis protein E7
VISDTMFSTSISDNDGVRKAFTAALHDAMERMTQLVPIPMWIPTPKNRRFSKAIKALHEIVAQIVANHSDHDGTGSDLLSMLKQCGGLGAFSRSEVRDQIMTILLAGHETTANSIAWTCYLLSQHPTMWRRVSEEVTKVIGDRIPNQADVKDLVWMRMAYEEALRLFPPIWLIPRRTIRKDDLGGYEIPANSDVLVSPWVIHRHPDYWENPDVFNPERFSPEHVGKRPAYSYLPFGAGPRACIGTSFANTEALLVLAMITQKFRLELASGTRVAAEPSLTLRFRNGLYMIPVLLQ